MLTEFQLWWLLALPVFFGLGWIAARIDIRHLVSESRALPRSYFQGLNFLLNEQPDKAIEALVGAVRIEPETVELHFALGALFRRRGEMDRAIRIHQNLIDWEDLAEEQRLAALRELGLDYLKTGVLDRAEEIFLRLKGTAQHDAAADALLEIYQLEKDWQKAIDTAREIERGSGKQWGREIAEFHCELAASEMTHSRPDVARTHIEKALEANRKCVRANIVLGDLLAAAGDHDGAITAWKAVEWQNPVYLALVAERLASAHRQLRRLDEGLNLLRGYLQAYPSLDLLDAVFTWVMEEQGARAAYEMVRDELRRNPTLLGLERLLQAATLEARPSQQNDIELVRKLVHSHTQRLARYRCDECGFQARQFYWRCPGCGGWETYPPRRNEEFMLAP